MRYAKLVLPLVAIGLYVLIDSLDHGLWQDTTDVLGACAFGFIIGAVGTRLWDRTERKLLRHRVESQAKRGG